MVGISPNKRKLKAGEMLCRVADESVVVLKFPPTKPGNGVEGKTEMTCDSVHREFALTGEALHCSSLWIGEIKGKLKMIRCGVRWQMNP